MAGPGAEGPYDPGPDPAGRGPGPVETVSLRRLGAATGVALIVAVAALGLLILPAEYGVDPVGTGAMFGLGPEPAGPVAFREDTVNVTVPAGAGVEYKLYVQEGDSFGYSWSAPVILFFDFHGEPEGAAPDEFTSHETGRTGSHEGSLTAPFTGTHGWYWENQGTEDVTLTLQTEGRYEVVGMLE